MRVAGRQLLLDCGMIQGDHDAPARNRLPFPFDPTTIDAVVLSHAHIDHCGRLPLLVKRGFRGPIYTNKAYADLVPILLRDSANLAMRDAERERVPPPYDLEDVETTLRCCSPSPTTRGASCCRESLQVRDAGHILGSSSIEVWVSEGGEQRKLVFSGDLGQYDTPILKDPFAFESADLVLMESTYGNRLHRGREDTERELGGILAQAQHDGGNVVVPAFAIGRSQELLYLLATTANGTWRWKIFSTARWPSPRAACTGTTDRFDEETTRLRELPRHAAAESLLSESADDSPPSITCPAARSSSPALAWRPAAACCITSNTISSDRSVTWSSSASRRREHLGGSLSTVRRKCAFMASACAASRRYTRWADFPRMAIRRTCCAGMTASRAIRRCTSCMVKCLLRKDSLKNCASMTVARPGLTIDLANLPALSRD
jgi:glyoxylase-like metal-dependent hydrolase (beta-lactamase superfamily II)